MLELTVSVDTSQCYVYVYINICLMLIGVQYDRRNTFLETCSVRIDTKTGVYRQMQQVVENRKVIGQ